MKKLSLLFLPFIVACQLNTKQLSGHWKAVEMYESGQTLAVSLDSTALIFSEKGRYEFRTKGFYREAGPFRAVSNYLFLTDTTAQTPQERTLQVLFLSDDTLKIRMGKGGKEQVLFLTKN